MIPQDLPPIEYTEPTVTEAERVKGYQDWLRRLRRQANDLEVERALARFEPEGS